MYNSTRQGLTHLSICKIIMDANLTSPWVSDLPISMLKHGLVEKQSISNNNRWRWLDEDNMPSLELAEKIHSTCKLIQLNRKQEKEANKKTTGLLKLSEYNAGIPTREQIKTVLTKLYSFYCNSPVFINTTILNNNKIPNPEFFLNTLEMLGFIKWYGTGYKWISLVEYDPYLENMIFDEYVAKYNQNIKKNNIAEASRILNLLYELESTNNKGGFPGTLMPMIKKHDLNRHHLTALLKLGVIKNLSKNPKRPLYKTKCDMSLTTANDVIKYIKDTKAGVITPAIVIPVTDTTTHPKAERLLSTLRVLSTNSFFGSVTKYFKKHKLSKDYVTTAVKLGYIAYGDKNKPVKILVTPNLKIADEIIKKTTIRLVEMAIARQKPRTNGLLPKVTDSNVQIQQILTFVEKNPKCEVKNVIEKTGINRATVYKIMLEQRNAGKLNMTNKLYSLADANISSRPIVVKPTNQTVDLNAMKERAIARKLHLESELAKVDKILNALDAVSKIGAEFMNELS